MTGETPGRIGERAALANAPMRAYTRVRAYARGS